MLNSLSILRNVVNRASLILCGVSAQLFLLVGCNQDNQTSLNPVSVIIDSTIDDKTVNALRRQGASPNEKTLEIPTMDYEGNTINFALERIVLKVNPNVSSGEFQSLVSRVSGKVIDDGRLPDPPSNINKAKMRPRFDSGYRLISVSPVSANLEVLAKRLEKRGVKGVVKFSSDRAAALVNMVLQINEDESAVVSASPNLVGFPTAAFAEQTSSTGGYSSTENNPALAQLRLSGSGGAWDYKYAGVPVDGRGVQIAIIDTGFEPGNYDMTSYDLTNGGQRYYRNVWGYDFTDNDYDVDVAPGVDCIDGTAAFQCYHGLHAAEVAAGARGTTTGLLVPPR